MVIEQYSPPSAAPDQADLTHPYDYAQEQAVLGGCLLYGSDLEEVAQLLVPGDFYKPVHERIYAAVLDLCARSAPVTCLTVGDSLGEHLLGCGDRVYLHELVQKAGVPGNALFYAQKLKRLSVARSLVVAGLKYQHLGRTMTDGTDLERVLATAAQTIDDIARGGLGVQPSTTSTYSRLDLEQALTDLANGTYTGPKARFLYRTDGKSLLYPAAVHSISGEPGAGKTWVALLACVQELAAGHNVAFIDFEDNIHPVLARLTNLGASPDQLRAHFRYIRPQNALNPADERALDAEVSNCTIVVIDGITEAMTINGLSPNDNDQVARWLHLMPNRIADLGAAVLQLDHVVKNSENRGRFAIGGQHKLAGITGTAYKAITVKTFAKNLNGHTKLVIDKDKHGDVGPVGSTAADLHVDASDPTGVVRAWLDPAGALPEEDPRSRGTALMATVSAFIQDNPGCTGNAIKKGVRGNREAIAVAMDALIREGHVRTEAVARGGSSHYPISPFEDPS